MVIGGATLYPHDSVQDSASLPLRPGIGDGSYRSCCFGAGLALSLGCEGGLLFTVAHELLHSTKPLDKALSNVLLCSVGYMHWTCSHLAHHRNVSFFSAIKC